MKKCLKIVGITLGSIIFLVVLVVSLALWVVFTPERLTPIVRDVAKDYIACEHHIGQVELTFFSTFPYFGVAIDSVTVIHPMEGAPSDTVVAIPQLVASVDVKTFLQEGSVLIPTLSIPDIQASIYVAADGRANYDILLLPSDTAAAEDTTATVLPFNQIVVEDISLSAKRLQYVSEPDTLQLALQSVGITLAADMIGERITLHQAQVTANSLALTLDGWAEIGDTLQTDMRITLSDWQVDTVLSLLPIELPKDIRQLVKGGTASLDATASINMQDGEASRVTIHHLAAQAQHSALTAKGEVRDPLGQLWMDIAAEMDVTIADMKMFLPQDMQLSGRVKGSAHAQMYMDDLLAMNLDQAQVAGDIQLLGIRYRTEEMTASLPNNRLSFHIPNAQPSRKEVDWLAATLYTHGGEVRMPDMAQATVGETKMAVEINHILGDSPYLHAALAVQSKEQVHAVMDSMDMTISQPEIDAYIAYHMTDSTVMPELDARVTFDRLYGYYTTIQADLQSSILTAQLKAPRLKASLQSQAVVAQMAEEMDITTQFVRIEAAARYNKRGGDNLLLKWNPMLEVKMQDAVVDWAECEEKIYIPHIDFAYNNRHCKIEQSKIILGNSDFALTGELRNMGHWMRERATLEGELNFVSEHTDVDELLTLLSADEGAEESGETVKESQTVQDEEEVQEPFLVPKTVDLTLNTQIKKASALHQTATNLGGKVYIKEGTLVVEEMGFICNAAKLQLTAMYRTPRRNHIYVGLDYHMLDINIQELVGMIPQIDSMMPMLRSFKGNAEFHLAAETYTNAQYEIKPSTLRGAASIFGKDLVVLDNETFDKISKLLLFSKKTENKVDSISAEMTLYKKEIDVYPFCVSIDNYMVALGGRHNLDMTFDYDVNVLSPIYLGVNVSGNIDDLDIKLAPCRFAKDFKPLFRRKVDTQSAELRSMIRESMRKNVKIKSEQ